MFTVFKKFTYSYRNIKFLVKFINNFINNIESIESDDFDSWRNSKKLDTKLTQSDIESYLLKRRNEEDDILNEVETSLSSVSKRKEVQKFLKNKHLSEEIEKIEKIDTDIIEKPNNSEEIKNNEINLENSTENVQIQDKEKAKPKENEIYIVKTKNVRKRELL